MWGISGLYLRIQHIYNSAVKKYEADFEKQLEKILKCTDVIELSILWFFCLSLWILKLDNEEGR